MSKPIHAQLSLSESLSVDAESRTISGTICIYDKPTDDRRGLVIKAGALKPRQPLDRVKLLRDHDQRDPVGYMIAFDPKTLNATFKVPEGDNGDRALWEASPEVKLRDSFSVGLTITEHSFDDQAGNVIAHEAILNETTVCALGAFIDAGVSSVKFSADPTPYQTPTTPDKENPVDPITTEDLTAALERFGEDQDRRIEARFANLAPADPTGPQFENFGALIRAAVVDKDEAALSFATQLAYEGAKTDDAHQRNTWIGDTIRLIEKNRKVLNSFTTEPLPAEGMNLEYMKLKSNSITIKKQSAEGEDLTFGKIELDSDTASVETYGGYTELSRQVIERASAVYTNTSFRAMDLEYARATEAATRALLRATITTQIAADNKIAIATDADLNAWLDVLVDATDEYEERGYTIEAAKVSKDVFKRLMRLEDNAGNRVMLVTGAGVNQVGEIDLSKLTSKLAHVRFELLPGSPENTGTFYDPLAITTWESPGAPWMVDQENNINLTKTFSKYGYIAQASQYPDALLPIEFVS